MRSHETSFNNETYDEISSGDAAHGLGPFGMSQSVGSTEGDV